MDSSESPTHGQPEGSACNGTSAVPVTNRSSCSASSATWSAVLLRPGHAQSAEGWRPLLEPVIACYRDRGIALCFRADAAFAKPEIHKLLEAEGIRYAIRLPANQVLQRRIGQMLTPTGRPASQEAGQDRRQDRAPRPLRGVPAGRGGGAAVAVRDHPAADR